MVKSLLPAAVLRRSALAVLIPVWAGPQSLRWRRGFSGLRFYGLVSDLVFYLAPARPLRDGRSARLLLPSRWPHLLQPLHQARAMAIDRVNPARHGRYPRQAPSWPAPSLPQAQPVLQDFAGSGTETAGQAWHLP